MTTKSALALLAEEGAVARPSLTGPEWHEVVQSNGHVVPLTAADFDRLRDAGLITARDEGSFVITVEGQRQLEGK